MGPVAMRMKFFPQKFKRALYSRREQRTFFDGNSPVFRVSLDARGEHLLHNMRSMALLLKLFLHKEPYILGLFRALYSRAL